MLTELDQHSANKNLNSRLRPNLLAAFTSLLLTLSTGMAAADDTEIFTAGAAPAPESTNVVFLIDTSGSMRNALQGDTSGITKIQKVQRVFENLIFDFDNTGNHDSVNPAMRGKNIALMRFDDGDSNGGYFLTRMRQLNNGSKNYFWTQIEGLERFTDAGDRISPNGYTPLAESAYEAARFFKGQSPYYGNRDTTSPDSMDNSILNSDGNYNSPFSNANNISECGVNNHLIILTDGMPTQDGDADTLINALDNTTADCAFSDTSSSTDCLPQVAEHLFNTNLYNDLDHTNVQTHTIAFDLRNDNDAIELLARTARLGGNGTAARADSMTELEEAIRGIFTAIQESAVSQVNPAVTVSSSNRFMHDNTVYFGLFKPMNPPVWPGNLKGYRYNSSGELMDFSTADIADSEPAIINGYFNPDAQSKWSDGDGAEISEGGAAEQVLDQSSPSTSAPGHTNRNLFTYISTTNDNNVSTRSRQAFKHSNLANLPNAVFDPDPNDNVGISDGAKEEIVLWATNRRTNPIGDPLHSTPQIIDYGGDPDQGGIGQVIFFSTNQGFVHAINAANGQELMGFIPESLIKNLRIFSANNAQDDHPYGLDGHISYYRHDNNNDGLIRPVDGDKVIVIVGMRRGGNEFIALDVTNPTSPTLQWTNQVKGGTGNYTDLGDTWSKPIITDMIFGSTSTPDRKKVVLIGGGYDNQYDELDNTISNPAGAALYAIDLFTGACVWSASDSANGCTEHTQISGMSHSVPSHLAAIDLTSDGAVDRVYAIDIMGRIFRVDFNLTDESGEYEFQGRMFADLSGGNRRYYYGVDVAFTNAGFTPKLHLSVGSGHRAHPLANSSDIIASVFDINVMNPIPSGFETIAIGSLTDLTSLETAIPSTSNGWYFNLPSNEKVLSEATSIAGYVFLTSYAPPGNNNNNNNQNQQADACSIDYGSGYVYAVNLANASPLNNDRAIPVASSGIPSSVAFMTLHQPGNESNTDIDNPLASQDTEVFAMVNGTKVALNDDAHNAINTAIEATKTYWYIGEPQEPEVLSEEPEEPVEP